MVTYSFSFESRIIHTMSAQESKKELKRFSRDEVAKVRTYIDVREEQS